MSNTFGDNFRVTTFGESHGPALGVVIDGLKAGLELDLEELAAELQRRRPGQSKLSSQRREEDLPEVLSGLFEGKTTGAPIAILFRNTDARPKNYEALKDLFRPGHADWTWWQKFGIRDWRGGGRSSGRETISRVAAGAIAKQVLAEVGVEIYGHVVSIGEIEARHCDRAVIEANPVRCGDAEQAVRMAEAIDQARRDGDSLGGVVEVVAVGVPAGWGEPVFGKLDARLGGALLSIGAVKGVEIGAGFASAKLRGSEMNDALDRAASGGFASNRAGGILGGISSGMPIVLRAAVKPTPSIHKPQQTVDVQGAPQTISIGGRHDPCICPRLVPVAEAMVAIVLCDAYLAQQARTEASTSPSQLAHEQAFCDAELRRWVLRKRAVGGLAEELNDEEEAQLANVLKALCEKK